MGNYVNNGKINLGERYNLSEAIKEIAGLLNVNPRSDGKYYLSDICMAENINKWSLCKPIEHPSTGPLTQAQRKGSADQQADGIFYGIKINGNISPTINASLPLVHNVTFEYIRPTGWKRLRDFNGYVHGAEASPSYNMGNEGTWEDESDTYGGIQGIKINYSTTGNGVNLMDRLVGVNADDTLKHAFPAIVVTKKDGRSFMTALFKSGTETAVPIMNSNGIVDSNIFYQCKMQKPLYRPVTTDTQNSPFRAAEVVRVSVILVKSPSTFLPLLALNGINFGDNWVQLEGNMATQAQPFVLAGENGMSFTLKDLFKGIKFIPNTISALAVSGNAPSVVMNYVETTGETSTNEITLTARVTITSIKTAQGGIRIPSGAGGTKVETLNGWNGGALINQVIVPCTSICQSGETWSGYVTLSTKDGNREAQNSGRHDFIFTVA